MIRFFNRSRNGGFRRFGVVLASAAFLSSSADLASPNQVSVSTPQQSIHVATDLVRVSVSVLDRHGNFVSGLRAKDFRVLDDGAPRPIEFFAPMDAPAQVLVLLETSPAVYLIHDEHLVALYALLDGLGPGDQVALATYDEAPHALLGYTADRSQLLSALGRIQFMIGKGQLNFYDSLSAVLDWLTPGSNKRAILLLTTGLDSSSPARWDALMRKLSARDVVIYSVALGGSLRSYGGKKAKERKKSQEDGMQEAESPPDSSGPPSFAKANEALLSLAAITGGRAYFPEKVTDFAADYQEVAATLRHQYMLGIPPARDAQMHDVTVEVLGNDGTPLPLESKKAEIRIFARKRYLAPGS